MGEQRDAERRKAAEMAKGVLAKHPSVTLGGLGCPDRRAGREKTEREARIPERPEPPRDQ